MHEKYECLGQHAVSNTSAGRIQIYMADGNSMYDTVSISILLV